jgi:hypothetical protein
MTVATLHEETCLEAWHAGCMLLLQSGGELCNLVTTIEKPCDIDESWLSTYSPDSVFGSGDSIRDVVNTIFPYKLYRRSLSREQLYNSYLVAHDRARRMPHGRHAWGTYFERLIRFPTTGQRVNQLERVIEKLNTWPQRNTTGLVFHLAGPVTDAPRTRGGPCWHFGEILWNEGDRLDLVVVYRNHDFFNKTLGNFIGLGRLLDFVCNATNKQAGKLICHSVHAYHQSTQKQLRDLAK